MKTLTVILLFFVCFDHAGAQSKDEAMIRTAMTEQVNAWNAGDINRFMNTYWHDDSLMFIGKSGVTYGWENTLKNYKKNYPDTATMGKLDFQLISVKRLSEQYYSVVGKWHLHRSVGDIGGAFTLLFRKIKNGWVIVSDHSS
jgi:ketosteroid isomerase-like protein